MNASCQSPVAIYQMDYVWNTRIRAYIDYIVPGTFAGCTNSDSLLYSQLLCLYSSSDCSAILMKYMKNSYLYNVEIPVWFEPKLLIYNSTLSRFPMNASISTLVEELMIEQWNPLYSYETFYSQCSPDYCSYTQKTRVNTILNVATMLLSMLGGLTISLRLFIPLMMKMIYKVIEIISHRQQNEQIRISRCTQLKLAIRNLFTYIWKNLRNLNIFSKRQLGGNHDRETILFIGKWTTRLYLSLFTLGLCVLTLYTILQPSTLIKTFHQPSLNTYKQLIITYNNNFKCSCSNITSKYEQFIEITPVFHQV